MANKESAPSQPLMEADEKMEDNSEQNVFERGQKIQLIEQSIKGDIDPSVTNVVAQLGRLLLETKKVLVRSMKESKIQRKNLASLLEILGRATDTGFETEDMADFDERLTTLQKWIDLTALQRVMEKWSELTKRLEAKKSKMQELVDKFKARSKRGRWFTGIAIGLGVVMAVAAVVVLIVCTSGAGAAITAGLVKTTGPFVTAHLVNASLGVGAGLAVASVGGCGVAYLWVKKPSEMAQQAQKITNLLKDMLGRIHEMQGKMGDMQEEEEEIEKRYKFLKDKKRVEGLKRDLKAIDQYLINYQQKGDAAVLAVRDAYNAFIEN